MEKPPVNKQRIQYMDYLNIIACFSVICLHSSQIIFRPSASTTWFVSVFIQSLFIFAVPIFFMISGANLLAYRRKYSTRIFFAKRFKKTFGALLLGSILVYAVSCFCPELFGRSPKELSIFVFLDDFLNNRIEVIYWFFYIILALYAFTPILSFLSESKKGLEYAIVFFFIITVILPLLARYIPSFEYINSFFSTQSFSGAVLFFLLGYYMQRYVAKIPVRLCVGVFCLCVLAMFILTLAINQDALMDSTVPFEGFFVSAFSLFSVGSSTALFLFMKNLESRLQGVGDKAKSIVKTLASASLGVYLIHLLVMNFVSHFVQYSWSITMTIEPIVIYTATVFVVILVQHLWVFIKQRIKTLTIFNVS